MKTICAMLLFSITAFADSGIIQDVEDVLTKYDACTGVDYDQNSYNQFRSMFEALKLQKGQRPLEVTEFNLYSIAITNLDSKQECTLMIDAYDGRCAYASCN